MKLARCAPLASRTALALCIATVIGCGAEATEQRSAQQIAPTWLELSGGDGYQEPIAVAAGPDGRVAMVGVYTGALESQQFERVGDESLDGFLLSYNAAGELEWAHSLSGPGDEALTSVTFVGDSLVIGGYAGTGSVLAGDEVVSSAEGAALLARFAANGELEWQRTFGGTGYQSIMNVSPAPDEHILVVGDFTSSIVLDSEVSSLGASDSFVAELDGAGALLWGHAFGSEGTEMVGAVSVGADGSFVVSGVSEGFVPQSDALLHPTTRVFGFGFDADRQSIWSELELMKSETHPGHEHAHGEGVGHAEIEDVSLLARSRSGGVIVGALRITPFGLHGEDFEAPSVSKAVLLAMESGGAVKWRVEIETGNAWFQLAAAATHQPLERLVATVSGEVNIGGVHVVSEGRKIVLVDVGADGSLGTVAMVEMPQDHALADPRVNLTAHAATTASDGSTLVAASIARVGSEDRDALLLRLPPSAPR